MTNKSHVFDWGEFIRPPPSLIREVIAGQILVRVAIPIELSNLSMLDYRYHPIMQPRARKIGFELSQ